MVSIAVTAERDGEPRGAVSPETVKKLTALGATVEVALERAKAARGALGGRKGWATGRACCSQAQANNSNTPNIYFEF